MKRKVRIHMMDQGEALGEERIRKLTEEEFDALADQCLLRGDLESFFELMDARPRDAERYMDESLRDTALPCQQKKTVP